MVTAVLTFDSEQVCAARRGLGGVWRVRECLALDPVWPVRVARACSVLPFAGSEKVLLLGSARPYRRGVMVNPRKIVLEYLRAMRGSAPHRYAGHVFVYTVTAPGWRSPAP